MFWFTPAIPAVAQSSPGLGAPEKSVTGTETPVPDCYVSTAATDVETGLFGKPPSLVDSTSRTVVSPSRPSSTSTVGTAPLSRRFTS